MTEYVNRIEGAWRVGGTRVSLDSLVYQFHEGMSAESIAENYPALTLEQVYGALTFYLAHQREVDESLVQKERVSEVEHAVSRRTNSELIAKLRRARHANQIPG